MKASFQKKNHFVNIFLTYWEHKVTCVMVLSCTSQAWPKHGNTVGKWRKNQVTLSNQSLSFLHLSALTLRRRSSGHAPFLSSGDVVPSCHKAPQAAREGAKWGFWQSSRNLGGQEREPWKTETACYYLKLCEHLATFRKADLPNRKPNPEAFWASGWCFF